LDRGYGRAGARAMREFIGAVILLLAFVAFVAIWLHVV
jgi:hypothetical protein